MNSIGFTTNGQLSINGVPRSFSSHNAYNLISGGMSLTNTVITAGMGTTLYTGNGTTQSVVTGVDMATQWGNSVNETFGGLVWGKSRSNAFSNQLYDTVRGATQMLISDLTNADAVVAQGLTSFNNNGFSIGNTAGLNTNLATQASWNFQTTHRITGTTNHGKAYTCHYNPFTGFTMIKYEGSGLLGHEIPHHLGRKLGFLTTKNLSAVVSWMAGNNENQLNLDLTNASVVVSAWNITDTTITLLATGAASNASTNQYIMYGWANSYFDEANTLIGNYEVGIYQGTGVDGLQINTKAKPAWLMIKRLDGTGNWHIDDNMRGTNELIANTSGAEVNDCVMNINSQGFSLGITGTTPNDVNAAGGQYLYMVVYDNDSGSGKSKYNKATDTSALSLTATIPFANGLDTNGTKNTVLTKNETVTGLTLTQGKNYVYAKNDGLYGVKTQAPQYGSYNGFGDYFDVNTNKWYQSPSVFSDTMDTTANWTLTNGVISIVEGKLKAVRSGGTGDVATKTVSTVVGKKYRIVGEIFATYTCSIAVISGGAAIYSTATAGTTKKTTIDFVAGSSSSTLYLTVDVDTQFGLFDNIAIYLINDDGSVDITSATPITESRNYLDAIVYADAGGQPTSVEQLPKVEYKKDLEVDTLKIHSGFDLNQKWYDVTTSRVLGATYTNTTGKPKIISVQVNIPATATSYIRAFVDNVVTGLVGNTANATSIYGYLSFIVPPFSKYVLTPTGSIVVNTWTELY